MPGNGGGAPEALVLGNTRVSGEVDVGGPDDAAGGSGVAPLSGGSGPQLEVVAGAKGPPGEVVTNS